MKRQRTYIDWSIIIISACGLTYLFKSDKVFLFLKNKFETDGLLYQMIYFLKHEPTILLFISSTMATALSLYCFYFIRRYLKTYQKNWNDNYLQDEDQAN